MFLNYFLGLQNYIFFSIKSMFFYIFVKKMLFCIFNNDFF